MTVSDTPLLYRVCIGNVHLIKKETIMTRKTDYTDFQEIFKYYGHTEVERIVTRFGSTVRRDWLLFDTIEEANRFFNENHAM